MSTQLAERAGLAATGVGVQVCQRADLSPSIRIEIYANIIPEFSGKEDWTDRGRAGYEVISAVPRTIDGDSTT